MTETFKRMSIINRNNIKSSTVVNDVTDDLKNDLMLAFNLFKNEDNKVNKLKLRTILFSFAMYKSPPKLINDFISEIYPKEEEFTFEQTLKLVEFKIRNIKEIESETLLGIINSDKNKNSFTKNDITKAFDTHGIEICEREITEMISFMKGNEVMTEEEMIISKEEFKRFMI